MCLLIRRDEDLVRIVGDGPKDRDIAQTLTVKEHSIRNCICRIFEKPRVSSRVELISHEFSGRDSSKYAVVRSVGRSLITFRVLQFNLNFSANRLLHDSRCPRSFLIAASAMSHSLMLA
jgi:DNA-binding CsgD family transcriptional regulator